MDNLLSGFQLVAISGLQNGEGIAPPNITVNLSTYSNITTVNNFSNIYTTANTLPYGLTSANANILKSIGANSFPHIFGQIPNSFSSELGTGPLFTIAPVRTTAWFANSSTANVYLQVLSQAQSYATSAQTVIGSASQSQWAGGPSSSLTGGFSIFGGNDPNDFQLVANAISYLGTLMIPSNPLSGFSNADCFNRILEAGLETIGNLHLNFFGKTITDPTTGASIIVNEKLFQYIINNPVGLSMDDTFQIVTLNPLDSLLGQLADEALSQTGDLDAVVTFFGVNPIAASSIYKWTDALNLELMLGSKATTIISQNLGITALDVYHFIQALVNSISGLTNISSMTELGQIMFQLTPIGNSPQLSSLSSPLSQQQFNAIQQSFGPGSGTNGNPTVDDILGSTNYNQALTTTTTGLQPLLSSTYYANMSSDTTKIASALTSNVFPVTLSDGSVYNNINDLAVGGSALVNNNASTLASIAPTVTDVSLFSVYNSIAQTHNNSANLTAANSFIPINPTTISSDLLSAFPHASGFAGMVLSIIFKFFGASQSVKIDNPPQPTMFLKVPGVPSFSPTAILSTFPSSLASMASLGSQISNADEITGLNNVSNCIDMTTLTGQALQATISEAKNNQILAANNLISQAFAINPTKLSNSANINVIGG